MSERTVSDLLDLLKTLPSQMDGLNELTEEEREQEKIHAEEFYKWQNSEEGRLAHQMIEDQYYTYSEENLTRLKKEGIIPQ